MTKHNIKTKAHALGLQKRLVRIGKKTNWLRTSKTVSIITGNTAQLKSGIRKIFVVACLVEIKGNLVVWRSS